MEKQFNNLGAYYILLIYKPRFKKRAGFYLIYY